MGDETLVDTRGMFSYARMWVMLKSLPGLDLPDFLQGAALAYGTVTRLMYAQDWEALRPLVSTEMLKAMQSTMDELSGDGRRVIDLDNEESIVVHRAVLRQVLILEGPEGADGSVQASSDRPAAPAAQQCHLDVFIVSHEKWQMMDYHSNDTLEPYDGRVRVQQSTWRFEGLVVPPASTEGDVEQEVPQANANTDSVGWTVHAIV